MSKWLANSSFSKWPDSLGNSWKLGKSYSILRRFILFSKKYLEAIADLYLDLEVIADLLVVSVSDNVDSIENRQSKLNLILEYFIIIGKFSNPFACGHIEDEIRDMIPVCINNNEKTQRMSQSHAHQPSI